MLHSLRVLVEREINFLKDPNPELLREDLSQNFSPLNSTCFSEGGDTVATCLCPSPVASEEPSKKSEVAAVAPLETGRVWGDPHFEGGDGDRFDLQGKAGKTYHLLSDTGLTLNGTFAAFEKNKTIVGETGLRLSGPKGVSRILVQARPKAQVFHNGRQLLPGKKISTADGGWASLSKDGLHLTVETREGYRLEEMIHKPGTNGEMEIVVRTPESGVAGEGRLPAGILGQTFDPDSRPRLSKDRQGKGAITGNYRDYEVEGGVFGDPSPKVSTQAANVFGLHQFMDELGLKASPDLRFPAYNPLSLEGINWQEEIGQNNLEGLLRDSARQAKKEVASSNQKINRLNHLLFLALKSGNLSLAMLLFAHLEAKEANELTRSLVGKLQDLQQKKRDLSQQIMAQNNDSQGTKNTQMIKTEIEGVNDDISVLQTFLRDIAQNKQQSLEMANGFITQEHQITMAVVRSFGR